MDVLELIEQLERGLEHLVSASPDGVRNRNDVGFSGATLGPGTRLAAAGAELWSAGDALKAWQICRQHNGQLGGHIPPITSEGISELSSRLRGAMQQRLETRLAEQGETEWGIPVDAWSAPKVVATRQGERILRKAEGTPEFWALWRMPDKQAAMKAAGIAVVPRNGSWEVQHWAIVEDDRRPERPPEFGNPLPLPAELSAKLMPYQTEPATQLAHWMRYGCSLDRSDMGTGKSYTALAGTLAAGFRNLLVVAPVATSGDWARVALHFGIGITFCGWEKLRGGTVRLPGKDGKMEKVIRSGRPDLVEFHPLARRYSWTPKIDAVIFDEIQRAKAPDTLNSKLVRDAVRQRIPVLGLSATPAVNTLDMRAIGYMLGLHADRDFYRWAQKNGVRKGRFGFEFPKDPKEAEQWLLPLFEQVDRRSVRVRKTHPAVAKYFPDNQIIVKGFSGSDEEIARVREEMQEELAALDARAAMDKTFNGKVLAVTARLRAKQRIDMLKVPYTIEFVQDLLEAGHSVVVGVNFSDSLDALVEGLKEFDPCVLRGGMEDAERNAIKERFQSNTSRLMLMNKQVGGAGIGLHDTIGGFPRCTVGYVGDSPLTELQFLGRCARNGAKSKVTQYIVGLWNDKVDAAVLENVTAKKGQLEMLTDGCLTRADLDPLSED